MVRVTPRAQATGEIMPPETRTEAGKFAAEYPTDGRELCALWDLGQDALRGESLKISRYVDGSQMTELVLSCILAEYRMEEVARDFGPGRYLLKPGPGPNRGKAATLNISEDFARKNGWRELPPLMPRQPAPSDRWMMERMQQATQSGMTPNDVTMMIELAVSKALSQVRQPEPPRDPVAPIMSGFELALTMMEKARGIVNPVQTVEKEPAGIADVLMTYGGDILSVLKQGLAAIQAPATPAAAPSGGHPASAAPKIVNPPNPSEEPLNLPQLTEEEVTAINPIMGVLNEFAPRLITFLGTPIPAETLGQQLAGMIGPDLEASALALAAVVEKHGPAILGIKHREMACDKAAAVVKATAEAIRGDQ